MNFAYKTRFFPGFELYKLDSAGLGEDITKKFQDGDDEKPIEGISDDFSLARENNKTMTVTFAKTSNLNSL